MPVPSVAIQPLPVLVQAHAKFVGFVVPESLWAVELSGMNFLLCKKQRSLEVLRLKGLKVVVFRVKGLRFRV